MIKFFRKIRQQMVTENRFRKYLLYAVGEIILVVIGILIALQINNLNENRKIRIKERAYLEEIRNNLKQDSLKLQAVLDFNKTKDSIVQEMMTIFVDTLTNEERFEIFNRNANDFTFYQIFEPIATAYNNLLAAETVAIISNGALREALSQYYEYDYLGGVQNRIMDLNRRIVDTHYPKFFTQEFVAGRIGIATKMPSVSDLEIVKDQKLLSEFFAIKMVIIYQNRLMEETQQYNQELMNQLQLSLQQ